MNPNNWTPFRQIPIALPEIYIPSPSQSLPPQPLPPPPVFIPISRKELVQRNSFYLNLFGMLVILGIVYFLYSIYLERKIFTEYLEYVKNTQEEHYPGFL